MRQTFVRQKLAEEFPVPSESRIMRLVISMIPFANPSANLEMADGIPHVDAFNKTICNRILFALAAPVKCT